MKPGTAVEWTSRFGAPLNGVVLRYDARRPLRKAGVRLGSWTNKFYKPMCLVAFEHPNGEKAVEWVKESRLKTRRMR